MPIFNPNEPQNGQKIDADVIRDQLNALKALVDDLALSMASLQAQINALKPVTHEATGFGDARANGVLTQDGMWNGYPAFRTPSGAFYHVADMTYYRCAPGGDPMNTMDVMYINPVSGTVTGAYTVNMGGMPPAGTVS